MKQLIGIISLVLCAIVAATSFAAESDVFSTNASAHGPLTIARDVDGKKLLIKNSLPVNVTTIIECSDQAHKKEVAISAKPGGPSSYSFDVDPRIKNCAVKSGLIGRIDAKPDGRPYHLPWRDGESYCIGQAPGSVLTTHQGAGRNAVDFLLNAGDKVAAARAGVVGFVNVGNQTTTPPGNSIEIEHSDGTVGRYAHISKAFVQVGDRVKVGQTIAEAGSSGSPGGPHLHLDVVVPTSAGTYETVLYNLTVGSHQVIFTPKEGMKPTAQYKIAVPAPTPSTECLAQPSASRFPTGSPLNAAYQHKK